MACACKDRGKKKFKVQLAGGISVDKNTEEEAVKFAAKHPGAKVIKPAA